MASALHILCLICASSTIERANADPEVMSDHFLSKFVSAAAPRASLVSAATRAIPPIRTDSANAKISGLEMSLARLESENDKMEARLEYLLSEVDEMPQAQKTGVAQVKQQHSQYAGFGVLSTGIIAVAGLLYSLNKVWSRRRHSPVMSTSAAINLQPMISDGNRLGVPVMSATIERPKEKVNRKMPKVIDGTKSPLYVKKEFPKVAGGLKIGLRKVVVITGASSGLGLAATKALVDQNFFVVAAVRDPGKMKAVAKENGIPKDSYVAMQLELASLQSVKDFVANLKLFLPVSSINHLICNAAVYRPKEVNPAWTDDGYEMSLQVNHLGHFLLVQLLLPDLKKNKGSRCCIVGSVTGNSNTIAGNFVKPVAALGMLEGLKAGGNKAASMPASPLEKFNGAKAYKDAKALNMMTVLEMHRRYHEETGVIFNSMYPGCIAETSLFREKRTWFRKVFPKFMKVIGAYVSEKEAGERLAQCISDDELTKSGVYWAWNGNARQFALSKNKLAADGRSKYQSGAGGAGGEVFENDFAEMISNEERGRVAYEYSMQAVKDYL